jgi:hypothetical protein
MTAEALLNCLAALDVRLTAAGARLRVEAPAGALTAELRAALVEHKVALLDLLGQVGPAADTHRPISAAMLGPDERRMRIPLSLEEPPSEWLAKRGLRIAGGDPATGTLFVAKVEAGELQVDDMAGTGNAGTRQAC